MLRVLQVIGKMDRAGAESLIMNLYRNIDRSKVQFDFLVFTYETADYDDEILNLGGKIYHMPPFKGYNYFDLCRRLKKFFLKNKYQIVHGHIGSLSPIYLYWAKKNGAYTIVHSHATNSSIAWERVVFWLLSHRVTKIADYFLACSEQAGIDMFGEKIVKRENFRVLKNCIDVEQFRYSLDRHVKLKNEFNLDEKVIFGHVGRFTEAKNHKFLLDVFKEISKRMDTAVLILVGRGELEDQIKKYVKELQLDGKVQFLGVRQDIDDIMNLFDVFVFTSVFEGLGNVCIEAQAAGLPCFVSSAIQDEAILTDNVWRYSLEWDAERWADKIINELQNFDRKDTSEKVIRAGYDVFENAKLLEQFYVDHVGTLKK